MKGFKFRLERLLSVRRLEEHVAQGFYLELRSHAQRAEAEHEKGLAEARQIQGQLAELTNPGSLDPHAVLQAHRCVESMHAANARRRQQLHTLKQQAEQARGPWQEARAAVRALETLREREVERFRAEQEKRDNRELDETAARRARLKHTARMRKTNTSSDESRGETT